MADRQIPPGNGVEVWKRPASFDVLNLLRFLRGSDGTAIYLQHRATVEDMTDEATTNSENQLEDAAFLEVRIRERAHHLWQLEGGQDDEYWCRAKEQLESDTQASYPPSASVFPSINA